MIQLYKIEKPEILKKKEDKWIEDLTIEKSKEYFKRRYNHKEIKEALIKETSQKCAYCESKILHIGFGHIEHIMPKKKFISKTFDWENLTLACEKCNISKGDYYDETYPILNPYTDNIEAHIEIKGPLIIYKTDRGKISINYLDLNRMELIEKRTEAIQRLNDLILNYNKEKNHILKEMIFNEINEYLDNGTEYCATLKSIIPLMEVCK